MTKDLFGQGPRERTLREARAALMAELDDGVICPCCDQMARLYTRKLNSGQARALIGLCFEHKDNIDKGGDGWVHFTPKHPTRDGGGDFAKLRFWGLVEDMPADTEKKRTSGYWKPTTKGREFALNRIRVLSHIMLYNGELKGFSGDDISIIDALGEHFNYAELMGR